MENNVRNIMDSYLKSRGYEKFDLKAVLFDMDGVLYDSMKSHSKAWFETMTEFELPSTPEEFYMHEGRTGPNTINLIIERTFGREATPEEKEKIYKRKSELFTQYHKGDTIPFAYDILKAVTEDGLEAILVTGSGQKTLLEGLNHDFPTIFSSDKMVTAFDVKHGKPHPEPYLMGLLKGGNLKPNQAIVVENAPMGVESAVAAGIFSIAVNTGPIPDQVLIDAGANIVFQSMKDFVDAWENLYKEFSR